MKITALLYFLFSSTIIFCQTTETTKVKIDTIKVSCKIINHSDIISFIPQVNGNFNDIVKNKINADIKKYFRASKIKLDSIAYAQSFVTNSVAAQSEYTELITQDLEDDPTGFSSEEDESFKIEYVSEGFLNISISRQVLPYKGQYQYFFTSLIYDLRTGNKLDFNDFISIDTDILNSIFRDYGYRIEHYNDIPDQIIAIDKYDEYVEKNLKDLDKSNDRCIEFYFNRKENDLHLLFKFKCAGPVLGDYGIPLTKLLPYIKYYEFKNEYKLFGKDINALKGYDYLSIGNKIVFDNYSVTNAGSGFLLPKDKNEPDTYFGIASCYSATNRYYLFLKYETKNNIKKAIIIDFIELKNADLIGNKLTEYCESINGADSELIALVKNTDGNPENYTKIIRAWRANRISEKFEPINPKDVKQCGNESYGQ